MSGEPAFYDQYGLYMSGPDEMHRVPDALSVTPFALRHVLIVGSCFGEMLGPQLAQLAPSSRYDHILFNHASALPLEPPAAPASYDCQLVILPLREIMQETLTMGLGDDLEAHQAAFEESARRLGYMLDGALDYHRRHHMLTFVATFVVPQQNGPGRLMPRRDLRNPVFYVEELNRMIAERIDPLGHAYLLDLDAICATFGRRRIQDDAIWLFGHGTTMDDWDYPHDVRRLDAPMRASALDKTQPRLFARALWREVTAMVRTVRQIDQVKLVAVDLDDTLWRGVIAEDGLSNPALTEGWPIALAEALQFLKRRGIMLALVSKNHAGVVEAAWDEIFGNRLALADFAVRKINWATKAENIGAICREVNVLPDSVVFIDDNPVERAAVQAAYPAIRVLGANPLLTRRILLWAPETQVAGVTAESAQRTEMVQAQLVRDEVRHTLSREAFLATLQLRVQGARVTDAADERFERALELLNKSNQFNTTGRRWTREDAASQFSGGMVWHVFQVADRFSRYGLVGVAVSLDATITQFVMSCRVVGLDAEIAMLAEVAAALGAPARPVRGVLVETKLNLLARDLFLRAGFVPSGADFVLNAGVVAGPPHIGRQESATELPAGRWRRLVAGSRRVLQRHGA